MEAAAQASLHPGSTREEVCCYLWCLVTISHFLSLPGRSPATPPKPLNMEHNSVWEQGVHLSTMNKSKEVFCMGQGNWTWHFKNHMKNFWIRNQALRYSFPDCIFYSRQTEKKTTNPLSPQQWTFSLPYACERIAWETSTQQCCGQTLKTKSNSTRKLQVAFALFTKELNSVAHSRQSCPAEPPPYLLFLAI